MQTKTCPRCELELPSTPEFFNRDRAKKDGLCSWCRDCNRKNSKKWHKKHYQQVGITPKIYEYGEPKTCTKCCETYPATEKFWSHDSFQHCGWNPWCKKCKNKARDKWTKNNKQRVKEYKQQWNKENHHHIIAQKRQRRHETGCHIIYNFNRKAKLNHAGEFFTFEWDALLNYYAPDGICLRCGREKELTVDHVVPVS